MPDTYYESAEDILVSKACAVNEIRKHGGTDESVAEFLREVGDRDCYGAQEVLRWLGY